MSFSWVAVILSLVSVAYSTWAVIVTSRAARLARANLEALRAKHAAERAAHARLIETLETEGQQDAR